MSDGNHCYPVKIRKNHKISIFKYVGIARNLKPFIETLLEKGVNGV